MPINPYRVFMLADREPVAYSPAKCFSGKGNASNQDSMPYSFWKSAVNSSRLSFAKSTIGSMDTPLVTLTKTKWLELDPRQLSDNQSLVDTAINSFSSKLLG